jgi:signal transduction histidine kinase
VSEFDFDKEWIAQILDNLLNNAIKFYEPETTIHVFLNQSNGTVSFRVQD